MRLARNILRRLPTGPNPPIVRVRQLLGSKLRLFFDARDGAVFESNTGTWSSWTDTATNITLRPASTALSPLAQSDGSNFLGRTIVQITRTPNRRMTATSIPNLVPNGSRSEVFCVGRILDFASVGNFCGVADPSAGNSGAQLFSNAGGTLGVIVGSTTSAGNYSDSTAVHLFGGYNDGANAIAHVDNTPINTTANGTTTSDTAQAAVGGFLTGFTNTNNAFIAAWGVVNPIMTTAERTRLREILRNDWGF